MTNAEFIVSNTYFRKCDDATIRAIKDGVDNIYDEYYNALVDDDNDSELMRCMATEIYMLREMLRATEGNDRLDHFKKKSS